jgi:hypothetical protein
MSDMLNALIQADSALLIGALVILLAYIALAAIGHLRRKYANPGLDAILNALTPFLYRAIVAGERAALQGLRDADAILTGAAPSPTDYMRCCLIRSWSARLPYPSRGSKHLCRVTCSRSGSKMLTMQPTLS